MAKCLPVGIIKTSLVFTTSIETIVVVAAAAALQFNAPGPLLALLASLLASTAVSTATILYTFVDASLWAFAALTYPLTGIAVYKVASHAMRVGDDCRVVALLSPFFTPLIPLTPMLCLNPRPMRYTRALEGGYMGAAPGASDAAVSHGGG